ncbi:MAG TPA: GNAT family N-acetyltransferase [Steroidobacteraceae bacterium]|nr:GNAT family N-acetyltransferase [Steroidobacteraceae bacterium]
MHILLETERLRLRHFTHDDVDLLVDLDSDPEVMRYITFGVPTPRASYVETYLPRWFEIYAKQPGLGYFAAELRGSDDFIGWFHLRDDRLEPEYLELGYRLRRSAWGQGFATEGGLALVRHAFETVGGERLSARTLARNLGSQRVMQKCGLKFAGRFEYAQDVIAGRSAEDRAAVKYELTRTEWLSRRG